jgi:hypothetical protein
MTAVKLSDEDKELIRSYVAEVDDEEIKKQRRKECADQYNVSLATISAVTAWTKIRANRTALESRPVEIVVKGPEDNAEGCHANYDNPTKQLWRQTWKKFLESRTLPHERQKMKVLCLPGKKCLEIPLYLDLGFNPQNIVGVEGGDEAAKMEFHQNAYRYGIVSKLGRLENLLAHDTNVYDVVSLDFTGPLSKTCLDIIRNLPIAPAGNNQLNTKSYFMVNLLAKRETAKGQLCLDFYASFTRPELMEMLNTPGMDIEKFQTIFGYMNDLADKVVSGERSYEEADLKDKRNMGLIFMLTSLIAKDRRFQDSVWSSYRINDVPLQLRQEIDFNRYAGNTLNTFLGGLTFYIQKKFLDMLMIAAPQIVETVSNYRPFIYGVEQYQYTSPVNNSNSPFITEMYEFMTPMADYIKLRYFVRFFVDAIFWQGLNAGRQIYLDVRDKHGHVRKPGGGGLNHKDSIGFVTEDGQVISTITFQRIMDAVSAFISHIDKDQSMNILSKGQNSRINLSD